MNVFQQVVDFLAYVFNGIYNLFLSTWPFNIIFILGVFFLLISLFLDLICGFNTFFARKGVKSIKRVKAIKKNISLKERNVLGKGKKDKSKQF